MTRKFIYEYLLAAMRHYRGLDELDAAMYHEHAYAFMKKAEAVEVFCTQFNVRG